MRINSLEDYHLAWKTSIERPMEFWGEIAEHFTWMQPWEKVVQGDFNDAAVKWFNGAKLNITENCLDRHFATQGAKPAIIWESNDPMEGSRTLTYQQLYDEVLKLTQVLRHNGIAKGDRVCIYMGMVPELSIALLACARVGAIHSVVFAGFSAQSITDRINDAEAKMIITADGTFRGDKKIALKDVVDEALMENTTIEKVLVLQRTHSAVSMMAGRDIWWHEAMAEDLKEKNHAEEMDAEDPLFILYTSGSTGKPKGVVHSSAGFMVFTTYTFINTFQIKPDDVYFCTADIGWITGHSYVVYAPLCAGATVLMFEGIPTWPDAGRLWDVIDKHKASILYTAPTAIRSLMSYGIPPLQGKDLSSLRVLGSVGEPINEEAWHWYHKEVGKGRCPIVDTWWQTETAGIMISNIAGITEAKPCFATLPLPGVLPVLVDDQGIILEGNNVSGNLCIQSPWPSVVRTTWGDHDRYLKTYFSAYPGLYFTGDGCLRDEQGLYRITGRVDDVLNVSGHRIGTAELENAINMHIDVIESAVVSYPHDIKGQGVYAYVVCDKEPSTLLNKEILALTAKWIGAIAKPDKIQIVSGLPKTRSGKIMRRILRKIAEGDIENVGDTSTLLDPLIVQAIVEGRIA